MSADYPSGSVNPAESSFSGDLPPPAINQASAKCRWRIMFRSCDLSDQLSPFEKRKLQWTWCELISRWGAMFCQVRQFYVRDRPSGSPIRGYLCIPHILKDFFSSFSTMINNHIAQTTHKLDGQHQLLVLFKCSVRVLIVKGWSFGRGRGFSARRKLLKSTLQGSLGFEDWRWA